MTSKDDPMAAPHAHGGHQHADGVDCRRLVSFLGDYVDGDLAADVKAAVDGHLAACAPCLAFLRQYKFAPEAVRRTLLESVPPDLESKVLGFLRQRCQKK